MNHLAHKKDSLVSNGSVAASMFSDEGENQSSVHDSVDNPENDDENNNYDDDEQQDMDSEGNSDGDEQDDEDDEDNNDDGDDDEMLNDQSSEQSQSSSNSIPADSRSPHAKAQVQLSATGTPNSGGMRNMRNQKMRQQLHQQQAIQKQQQEQFEKELKNRASILQYDVPSNSQQRGGAYGRRVSKNMSVSQSTDRSLHQNNPSSTAKHSTTKGNSQTSNGTNTQKSIPFNTSKDYLEQDYRTRLQAIEKTQLAANLGICTDSERVKADELLSCMIQEEIPTHIKQEIDPEGKIVYFNTLDKVSSSLHPEINRLRRVFYDKQFKEDHVPQFASQAAVPTDKVPPFKTPPLLNYYKANDANFFSYTEDINSLSSTTTTRNGLSISKGDVRTRSKFDSVSMKKPGKGNSISRSSVMKSISGSHVKSITRASNDRVPGIEKLVPISMPKPQLMVQETKLFSLTPTGEAAEFRHKELLSELKHLKEAPLHRSVLDSIDSHSLKNQTSTSHPSINPQIHDLTNSVQSHKTHQFTFSSALKGTSAAAAGAVYDESKLTSGAGTPQRGKAPYNNNAGSSAPPFRNGGGGGGGGGFHYQSDSGHSNKNTQKHLNTNSEHAWTDSHCEISDRLDKNTCISSGLFGKKTMDYHRIRSQKSNELETIERELYYSTLYYENKYGIDLFMIQSIIENTKSYKRAHPEDVIQAMVFLSIRQEEESLYWIARCYVSLDLPDFWVETYDEITDDPVFVNQLSNVKINIHPAIVFLQKILAQARAQQQQRAVDDYVEKNAFKHKSYLYTAGTQLAEQQKIAKQQQQQENVQENEGVSSDGNPNTALVAAPRAALRTFMMSFESGIGRIYSVNMMKLTSKMEQVHAARAEHPPISTSNKVEIISQMLTTMRRKEAKAGAASMMHNSNEDDRFWLEDFIEHTQTNDDQTREQDEINNPENIDATTKAADSQPDKLKHVRRNSNLTDQHILVLSNELGLKFPEDVNVLMLVHEFLENKEVASNSQPNPSLQSWRFRCLDSEKFYWFHPKLKKTQTYYPHLSQLKELVTLFQLAIKKDLSKVKVNKRALKLFKLFDHRVNKTDIYARIKQESKEFIKTYIGASHQVSVLCIDAFMMKVIAIVVFKDYQNISSDDDSGSGESRDGLNGSEQEQQHHSHQHQNRSSAGYTLKHVMDILRNRENYTDEEVKEKILFNWPLKFKYKENAILNKPKYVKSSGNAKHKAQVSVDAQMKLKENQKKGFSKLQTMSRQIANANKASSTSKQRSNGNLSISRASMSSITAAPSSNTSAASNSSDPFKIKQPPPTSYQVLSQQQFFHGKVSKDQYNFSSHSESDPDESKSSSSSSDITESEDEIVEQEMDEAIAAAIGQDADGRFSSQQQQHLFLIPPSPTLPSTSSPTQSGVIKSATPKSSQIAMDDNVTKPIIEQKKNNGADMLSTTKTAHDDNSMQLTLPNEHSQSQVTKPVGLQAVTFAIDKKTSIASIHSIQSSMSSLPSSVLSASSSSLSRSSQESSDSDEDQLSISSASVTSLKKAKKRGLDESSNTSALGTTMNTTNNQSGLNESVQNKKSKKDKKKDKSSKSRKNTPPKNEKKKTKEAAAAATTPKKGKTKGDKADKKEKERGDEKSGDEKTEKSSKDRAEKSKERKEDRQQTHEQPKSDKEDRSEKHAKTKKTENAQAEKQSAKAKASDDEKKKSKKQAAPATVSDASQNSPTGLISEQSDPPPPQKSLLIDLKAVATKAQPSSPKLAKKNIVASTQQTQPNTEGNTTDKSQQFLKNISRNKKAAINSPKTPAKTATPNAGAPSTFTDTDVNNKRSPQHSPKQSISSYSSSISSNADILSNSASATSAAGVTVTSNAESSDTKPANKDMFLWKIESKKHHHSTQQQKEQLGQQSQQQSPQQQQQSNSKLKDQQQQQSTSSNGHLSRQSSTNSISSSNQADSTKGKVEDSFKSLLENNHHFKDKGSQKFQWADKGPRIVSVKQYISEDKIIAEEDNEDEIVLKTEDNQMPQILLSSVLWEQNDSPYIQVQSSPTKQPNTSHYQTIPLSQKALNRIIYSPFMTSSSITMPLQQSPSSSRRLLSASTQQQQQSARQIKDGMMNGGGQGYPEVKVLSSITNSQIRNGFVLNSRQMNKVKKDAFFVDPFNQTLFQQQQQEQSIKAEGDKARKSNMHNTALDANNNPMKQQFVVDDSSTVKKVFIFPTLQAPTNHLMPRFSPRSSIGRNGLLTPLSPSSSSSLLPGAAAAAASKKDTIPMCRSMSPVSHRIDDFDDGMSHFSSNSRCSIASSVASKQRSFLESHGSRSSLFSNQMSVRFVGKNSFEGDIRPGTASSRYTATGFNGGVPSSAEEEYEQQQYQLCDQLARPSSEGSNSSHAMKLAKKLNEISKYQDDQGSYQIKTMLCEILKQMPSVHFDVKTRVTSKLKNLCTSPRDTKTMAALHTNPSDSYQIFAIEAQAHLELIKLKFLKKKLDIIAFDFIMMNLHVQKEVKKTIYDSELLKSRIYRHLRSFFREIRGHLLTLPDIVNNLQRMIHDTSFEAKMIPKLYYGLSRHFAKQLTTMNNARIFEQILIFDSKKRTTLSYAAGSGNIDEELAMESIVSDCESEAEDIHDLNPFEPAFSIVKSKVLNSILAEDRKKQRKMRKLFQKIENDQQIENDSDEENEYYENVRLYRIGLQEKENALAAAENRPPKSLFGEEGLLDAEQLKKLKKKQQRQKQRQAGNSHYNKKHRHSQVRRHKQSSRFDNADDFNSDNDSDRDNGDSSDQSNNSSNSEDADGDDSTTERIEILTKIFATPKYIFLFQSFLEAQERIFKLEQQSEVWKLLVRQIGHVHSLYRDITKRVEMYLDYGMRQQDLHRMGNRLSIDFRREGDLIWIAYFYCGMLLRFCGTKDRSMLAAMLDNAETTSEYDTYFLELVALNRVKRQFILNEMNEKNSMDYSVLSQWFKFYDAKSDRYFVYNPVLCQRRSKLHKKYALLQEQFRAIEKYKFIEMIDFIMRKLKAEDENETAQQFNILFEQDRKPSSSGNTDFRRSMLDYKQRNSMTGSIMSLLDNNIQIASHIKSIKPFTYSSNNSSKNKM